MAIQLRNTRQKAAIRAAFEHAGRPLSHDEALALAQQQVDGLSLATVYRNVNQLVDEHWLVAVEVPGAATRYEVAGKDHHHHFQCKSCGRLFELEGCGVDLKAKLPRGFRSTGHELYVYGLCVSCV